VIDVPAAGRDGSTLLKLNANAVTQRVVCYLESQTYTPGLGEKGILG
jgi:hypothetical protein